MSHCFLFFRMIENEKLKSLDVNQEDKSDNDCTNYEEEDGEEIDEENNVENGKF